MITVAAPPSKSLSHRTLIASALADGPSHLDNVLESDDTARTKELLERLGAVFERTGPGKYRVQGLAGRVSGPAKPPAKAMDVGESGTTCRLGLAVLAAGTGLFRLHGAGRMHKRPVGELARALRSLGADITYEAEEGFLPLTLHSAGFARKEGLSATVSVACDESSQYLSGLLLAAPVGAREALTITLAGCRAVSWPYVALTLDTLERFGITFATQKNNGGAWLDADWKTMDAAVPGEIRFKVYSDAYQAGRYTVEGDWSGASYFLAAGAVGTSPVRVEGLKRDSMQADAAIKGILRRMGARVESDDTAVSVYPSALRGVRVDMGDCPDLVPTVAALAYHASGTTEIRGAAHLAHKESNRIAAPAEELRKAGCTVEELPDGLRISPPATPLQGDVSGRVFSSHGDHRLAMSLALLGLPGRIRKEALPVTLDDPACVSKSFPLFWDSWARILAR